MGRKYIKIFRNCVLSVICIVLVVFMIIPDYIMCFFSRNFYFREYIKGSEKIYFLGTYHNMTLDSTPYSYLNLKSVIENLRPDLLLIESRPEQLKNGNFADGPGEMLYSHLIANKLGIVVKGVDWWSDSGKNVPNSTNPTRDEYINKNILKEIPSHKKVLILMGSAHVTLEEPKLEQAGYKRVFFPETAKIKLLKVHNKKLVYPKGMTFYIKKRINYEKSCIGTVYKTDAFKKQASIVIQELNREVKVIEQTGEE